VTNVKKELIVNVDIVAWWMVNNTENSVPTEDCGERRGIYWDTVCICCSVL
jgi:hypothetical protein